MDVVSLFPMEILYYFTGVNSLLRFPRLLKVSTRSINTILSNFIPCLSLSCLYFKSNRGFRVLHRWFLWTLQLPQLQILLCFPSQYMAFFEFNDRMEAVMKKAYIYR